MGLCSISFRNNTPEEILKAMCEAELSYIEWGSDVHCPPEKAKEIAELQEQYEIFCCSYGTYFRLGVTPIFELEEYIKAAKTLGTNVLRLWCGNKNSEEYNESEKKEFLEICTVAANIAEEKDVIICMECHSGTYTNTKNAALELISAVNSKHFRMYWQPNQMSTRDENLEYATAISPYTENIHVFNWRGDEKLPLEFAKDIWKNYLDCFSGEHNLLLEFMPDDKIETLKTEACTLKLITK